MKTVAYPARIQRLASIDLTYPRLEFRWKSRARVLVVVSRRRDLRQRKAALPWIADVAADPFDPEVIYAASYLLPAQGEAILSI